MNLSRKLGKVSNDKAGYIRCGVLNVMKILVKKFLGFYILNQFSNISMYKGCALVTSSDDLHVLFCQYFGIKFYVQKPSQQKRKQTKYVKLGWSLFSHDSDNGMFRF